jgi:hypothetical protein
MTESNALPFQGMCDLPRPQCEFAALRCYFLSGGHIVAVEVFTDLSDEEAVAKAHQLFLEEGPHFEGFEVWERTRMVIRHPAPQAEKPLPSEKERRGLGAILEGRFLEGFLIRPE